MALISYYDTGFATVANGSRDITGTGTQWLSSLRENDVFVGKDGRTARIGAVLSNTSLRLARNWPGDSQTSDVYEVRITPAPSEITASVRELLEKLRQGLWLTPNATGTLAERAAYNSARRGFIYMRTDVNPFLVYVKTTDAVGAWSDGYAPQQGPSGPYTTIQVGTVTTVAPDQPAAINPVQVGDVVTLNFSIPRGPTGDIDGVTPFWVMRLGSDADAAAARVGLEVPSKAVTDSGFLDDVPFPKGAIGMMPITRFDGRHKSLDATIFPLADKWVMVYRDASGHSPTADSVLKCSISVNNGARWSAPVTIYNKAGIQISLKQGAPMANGRIGFLAGRRSSGGSYANAPLFMYSDNGGATWTSVILNGAGHPASWSGSGHQLLRWPASAGGHDTNGFIAYSSSGLNAGNVMYYLRTNNNGTTWTSGTAVTAQAGIDMSTCAIVRLGDSNRWIMLVRQNQSQINGTNALFFKSTDMMTWTGPFDTGQLNNNNPHTATYWNGKIYWLATPRTTGLGTRAIPPTQEGFVHQWRDAEAVWSENGTVWPGWQELAAVGGMEGHPTIFTHNGQPYCVFGYNRNEAVDSSGTLVGLMGVGVKQPLLPEMGSGPTRFHFTGGWVDRYPDGRQELERVFTGLGPIDTVSGSVFVASLVNIGTWFLPFVERPTMTADVVRSPAASAYVVVTQQDGITATSGGTVRLHRYTTSSATDFVLTVRASGRWYAAGAG